MYMIHYVGSMDYFVFKRWEFCSGRQLNNRRVCLICWASFMLCSGAVASVGFLWDLAPAQCGPYSWRVAVLESSPNAWSARQGLSTVTELELLHLPVHDLWCLHSLSVLQQPLSFTPWGFSPCPGAVWPQPWPLCVISTPSWCSSLFSYNLPADFSYPSSLDSDSASSVQGNCHCSLEFYQPVVWSGRCP